MECPHAHAYTMEERLTGIQTDSNLEALLYEK